jgi:hypothetical protein
MTNGYERCAAIKIRSQSKDLITAMRNAFGKDSALLKQNLRF